MDARESTAIVLNCSYTGRWKVHPATEKLGTVFLIFGERLPPIFAVATSFVHPELALKQDLCDIRRSQISVFSFRLLDLQKPSHTHY
jgi:hypothetical protein